MEQYGIEISEIAAMKKSELKKKVKRKINEKMNKIIQKAAENMTKLRFVKGESFERKKYMNELGGYECMQTIRTRLNMQPVYQNYKGDIKLKRHCPYCLTEGDKTEHLVECQQLGRTMLTAGDLKNTENIQLWRQLNERITFNLENRGADD